LDEKSNDTNYFVIVESVDREVVENKTMCAASVRGNKRRDISMQYYKPLAKKVAEVIKQRVDSSNLDEVEYDDETLILRITFKNGGRYEYYGVPKDVYEGLMGAESKGSWFYYNVRNNFGFKKL
jgi:hypothetical protein